MTRIECDIIQDLLPLYQDQICSEKSCNLVETHLQECSDCRKVASSLQTHTIEDAILMDAKDVFETHKKKERRRSATAGMIMTVILLIPIIICFICNLAVGGGLNWFFIVLTALLVAASVTLVPLFSTRHKLPRAIMAMTGALILLYLASSLVTGGRWFGVATIGTVFGLSTICLPLILLHYDQPQLRGKVGIISMLWDSIWFLLLVIAGAVHTAEPGTVAIAAKSVLCFLPAAWIIFLICRYLPLARYFKKGISLMVAGVVLAFASDLSTWAVYGSWDCFLRHIHLASWTGNVNGNIYLCILFGGIVIGALVIVFGALKTNLQNRKHK